jgi:hypothetical protein
MSTVTRRSLPDLFGWAFVSVVALMALVGIAGEWLGIQWGGKTPLGQACPSARDAIG